MTEATAPEGFTTEEFTHDGKTRTVWRRGSGPGVVVMHEIPGPTPNVMRFARIVADHGYTVFVPWMFGVPDKPASPGYVMQGMLHACISREFHVLAAHRSSPITDWLRALCRDVHARLGGKGVGAVGMCLTGNFALALMVDEAVMAPVLSQPSLPFPLGKARKSALHVSDEALVTIKRRASAGAGVLGLRFTNDPAVPPERFACLKRELGDGFEAFEIDSSPGNPHGIKRMAHSVLTEELVDEAGHPTRQALDRVLALFAERLR